MIKIGARGGLHLGESWDEKGHSRLTQIFISYSNVVRSIQFQYEENGSLVLSDLHGMIDGTNFTVVKFRFPDEYLTGMRVCYESCYVKSLTFITNLRSHGPFGLNDQRLSEFLIELGEGGQFGGFHGTANGYGLHSIGVYLQPCTTPAKVPVDIDCKCARRRV